MSEPLLALVEYRLARAWETLEEARDLSVGGHWNGVANRLYYACFYAVGAWLVCHGLSSVKHTGVRSLVNQQLVVSGRVSKAFGRLYNDLFELRQESDYEDFISQNEEDIAPLLPQVEQFVACIAALVYEPSTDHGGRPPDKEEAEPK